MLGGLGAITAAFVLVVLPQRYVLQTGLVESGITFPTGEVPFQLTEGRPVLQPPVAALAPPAPVGPAGLLWNAVIPLLENEELEAAIRELRQFLAEYPEDADVWREYATTLARAGRNAEAEVAYRRLIEMSSDPADLLALARLLRDSGDRARSLELYRELVAANPEDLELYHEFAQALVWAERYDEAVGAYRRLLSTAPVGHRYRLEMARVLYWAGYPVNALSILADLPDDAPDAREAAAFGDSLRAILVAELPLGETTVERARRAVGEEDYALAATMYNSALIRYPHDAGLWLEWTDFLQDHAVDMEGARDALLHLATLRDLSSEEEFRLAQLYMWTEQEDRSRDLLVEFLAENPDHADAWALLGDLYQWQGSTLAAADAYERALALSPTHEQATIGLATVRLQVAELIAERESPRAGPEVYYFQDSDDFERLDLGAQASFLWSNTTMMVRGGYRSVHGTQVDGTLGTERGAFAEVEIGYWWRLGTIRTSVTTGAEQFDVSGTEPTLGARVEVPDMNGTAVQVTFTHGRAFSQTATLGSIRADLLSDDLQASAFRQISERWSVSGNAGLGALHGTGDANPRINAAVTARRAISQILDGAIVSYFITLGDSAPSTQGQRLYWDPAAFWSNSLQLDLHTAPVNQWRAYARLTPGLALVDERTASGVDLVPQLSSEAGLSLDTDRLRFNTDVAFLRGREGEYNSFFLTAVFTVKY
jgi:cytochrome c-type biogenesis protein CcmH/NrfG